MRQFHEDLSRKHETRGSSDRSFGILFALLFVAIALLPAVRGGPVRLWAFIPSAGFLIAAFARPSLLRPLNKLWLKIGLVIGRVVNPVVMAVMFYLVFTPLGLFLRLMGKDPLRLRFDPDASSYWIERRPPGPPPESMSNQF